MDKQLEYYKQKIIESSKKGDKHALDYWLNQHKMRSKTIFDNRTRTKDDIKLFYLGVGYQMCLNDKTRHEKGRKDTYSLMDLSMSENYASFKEGQEKEKHTDVRKRFSWRYRKGAYED